MRQVRSIPFNAQPIAWLFGTHDRPRRRLFAVACMLLSLAALAWALWSWVEAKAAHRARLDANAAMLMRTSLKPAPVLPHETPLSAAQRTRLNQLARTLNTPWAAIFESLELGASPQVALLSIEPSAERGTVRVETEGPTLDALLQHAERVQAAAAFANARLLRIDSQDAAAGAMARLSFDLRLAR